MRRIAWMVAFALAAFTISLTLVTPSGALRNESTLTFVVVPVSETALDVDGDHELTPGDGWVQTYAVRRGGERIGSLVSSCQFMSVRADGMGGVMQCVGTVKLPAGQLTSQGRVVLIEGVGRTVVVALTGGTGRFATASGYVAITPIDGSSNGLLTIHLVG